MRAIPVSGSLAAGSRSSRHSATRLRIREAVASGRQYMSGRVPRRCGSAVDQRAVSARSNSRWFVDAALRWFSHPEYAQTSAEVRRRLGRSDVGPGCAQNRRMDCASAPVVDCEEDLSLRENAFADVPDSGGPATTGTMDKVVGNAILTATTDRARDRDWTLLETTAAARDLDHR